MQIRYIHQKIKPLLPAIGDIRIVPELIFKSDPSIEEEKAPEAKLHIAKCIKVSDHHVFYEYLGEDFCEAVPYEIVEKYGQLSIDLAIQWIIDSYMKYIMESKSLAASSMFVVSDGISDYFTKLQFLVVLSKQTLKEAERVKTLFQKTLSSNDKQKK